MLPTRQAPSQSGVLRGYASPQKSSHRSIHARPVPQDVCEVHFRPNLGGPHRTDCPRSSGRNGDAAAPSNTCLGSPLIRVGRTTSHGIGRMYNSKGGRRLGRAGRSRSGGGQGHASGGLAHGLGRSGGMDGGMGIRFYCPNGHKLNVKEFQGGRKGICPYCGTKIQIPTESTRPPTERTRRPGPQEGIAAGRPVDETGGSGPDLGPEPAAGISAGVPGGQRVPETPAEPAPVGSAASAPAVASPVELPAADPAPRSAAAVAPQSLPAAERAVSPAEPAGPAPAGSVTAASSPAADPLAEAGDAVWYVRPGSGGQFGPAGNEVMRSWLQQGRVGADSLVWREGWPDWREAGKVFPQLGAGRPDSPLGEITAGEGTTTSATVARSRRAKSRRQSKKTQTVVITSLVVAVIVLFCVFLWVVLR